MPKSAQKRSCAVSKAANSDGRVANSDHDYEDGMIHDLANEEEFPPLPLTPSKPPIAKKLTLSQFSEDNLKSDEIVAKLAHLINTRSDALEEMVKATRGEIKDLKEKLGSVERCVSE